MTTTARFLCNHQLSASSRRLSGHSQMRRVSLPRTPDKRRLLAFNGKRDVMTQATLPGLGPVLFGRRCNVCGEVRPMTEFYRDTALKDGRAYRCKMCTGNAQRAYHAANRGKLAAKKRIYNEEHKEERSAYDRAYYEANKEERNAKSRAYYEANKKELAAKMRAYFQTARGRAVRRSAEARRRTLPGGQELTSAMIQEVMEASGGVCPYCGELFENGHIDHIIPVSKGGTNDRENLVYVCARCNMSKGARPLVAWLRATTTIRLLTKRHFLVGAPNG